MRRNWGHFTRKKAPLLHTEPGCSDPPPHSRRPYGGGMPPWNFSKLHGIYVLDVVECSDASFRDSVLVTLMVIVAADIHIRKDIFRKKCWTVVASVRVNLLMVRKRDSSHWL
jgi:hypothetical protein